MAQFRPRHVLVTGGAGFIGSNFVRHCLKTEIEKLLQTMSLCPYRGYPRQITLEIANGKKDLMSPLMGVPRQ